ncbi:hypothetical protein SH591_09920 [Sphingomonas sp. LY54]|uniref:hypothetical protein n=1 Tax=Sphingomonas sp. LY54 TaxID=3095343 RepID=UPI002D78ADBD|nr:hypothetical protein [Sphingomonas sp. LY54]WRP27437.1 hypothetical protein SH591_09920 [Sphingomonas sp. LY54]
MRVAIPLFLAASLLSLGGCAAGMAMSAAGMAARAAQGTPQANEHLRPSAVSDCTARAAQYGTVHIIDAEQRSASRIIVWGTVDDDVEKRSFECTYGNKITGFKLRPIRPLR